MDASRLEMLQLLLRKEDVNWAEVENWPVDEPVEFQRRWPRHSNVVDLPVRRTILFEKKRGRVAIFDGSMQRTPSADVFWIEAEGVVITAWAAEEDGDGVADRMIGKRSPDYTKAKRTTT